MAHRKGYILKIDNFEEKRIVCEIFDGLTYQDEPIDTQFVELTGAEKPLVLSTIDNDEDKFTPIKAHQLQINFLSTPNVNLNHFIDGPDNRWYVKLWFDPYEYSIFEGFVSLSDIQEDFLCEPNVVTLTAYDGIGLLKDIPLTDYNGVNPKGKYSLIKYLSFALHKTDLDLPINIAHSLWSDNMNIVGGIDLGWHYTYLDAKTFEDEIGTSVDCYEALEKILGQDSFLTQYRGEWWIVRVEEMDGRGLKVHRFSWNGDFISVTGRTAYERDIFSNGDAFFANESTYVTCERPLKSVKETYNYEYPKEIIDNINFERGAVNYVLTPPANHVFFHIDDWQVVRPFGQPVTSSAYYARKYEDGYEKEGYAVVTPQSVYASPYDYLRCNPVDLQYKDKVKISVDFRFDRNLTGIGGMTQYIFFIYLVANGKYYYLSQDVTGDFTKIYWHPSNTENVRLIGQRWDSQQLDERDWQSISVTAPPLPEDGLLYVGLMNGKTNTNFNGSIHYKNLQVEIEEYINGSYAKYDGHYFKTSQTGGYNAVKEEEVSLNDSPRKLFKGALYAKQILTLGGHEIISYHLSTKWVDRSNSVFSEWKPYGWWQAFSVWNQYKRTMRLFDAQVQGCYGADLFGLMHLFNLKDTSPHTNKKKFMLLHYELDLRKCEWSGVMAEMIDTDKPKTYSETDNNLEFKYVESR
jgi:hypothetical protein